MSESSATQDPSSSMAQPPLLRPVIECRGITRVFNPDRNPLEVLRGVDFDISSGEQVAIVGASGVGKSTLLQILGGLDDPSSGSVHIHGVDMVAADEKQRGRIRNQYLGFIYQFHHLLPEFTALENVAMPLMIAGQPAAKAAEQAADLLDQVGLGQRLSHKPGELSGGERQRAAVARALINRPACVLGDEPTGNLDEKTAENVYGLMLELNQELGISFIVVTHDHGLARRMDRRLEMRAGVLHDAD